MSAQLSLTYSPAYLGGKIFEQRLDVLRSAVNHLGLKEVSFELDVSGSMLSDALNERDRKRWAAEWVDVLKAMLAKRGSDEIATDILRRLCDLDVAGTPFIVRDEDALTPEDEATWARVESIKRRRARAR